jgi:hypothetical protein
MTSIVYGGAFNTAVLNPPNLNGFGAGANTWSMSCSVSPCIPPAASPISPRDSGNSSSQTNPALDLHSLSA